MAIIPEKHKKYHLLERWKGCEIFVEDWELKDDLCELLGADRIERSFESIDEAMIYYDSLKNQIQAPYKNLAADLLTEYVQDLEKKNHREVWSVLRYKSCFAKTTQSFLILSSSRLKRHSQLMMIEVNLKK